MKNPLNTQEQFDIKRDMSQENCFIIKFAVKANASKNRIYLDFGGMLKIEIKSPPVKNKANKSIIKFLSKKLAIPTSNIRIIKGLTTTTKIFHIKYGNATIEELKRKILA